MNPVLRRPGDGAVRPRIRTRSPGTWTVDQYRVRVPKRMVPGRHQLDSKPRGFEVAGARVIGLDRDLFAARLDADPRACEGFCRLELVVDQVDEDLRLKLGLALPPQRSEDPPRPAVTRCDRRDERVHGSLLRLQPVHMRGVELEVAAAVLEQHPGSLCDNARAESVRNALDQRHQVAVLIRCAQINGVTAIVAIPAATNRDMQWIE